jgi:hydrophobe/amphiphile efflux-3 (HAE3) family protein
MEKLFRNVLKIKWVIVGIVLIITIYLGWQIPSVKINSDVVSSLPDDDKDAVLLKKIGLKFGGNKTGMIIIETEDVFTAEVIEHVKVISDTISEIEGVESVTSLTSIISVKTGEDGFEIGKLIDEDNLPQSKNELTSLKEKVLSEENYKGTIVSEDGTSTIIMFSIDQQVNMQSVARMVESKISELNLPEKIYFAGSPMLLNAISRLIAFDLTRLLPIAFLVITLVLYLGFRSMRGVILPLLTSVLAIIWVIGIMSLAGSEMTMISNNIPIILLAVGTAYSIHVINRIDQEKDDLNKALITALKYVTIPVILAALTTIAGFLSFLFGSYLTMIRDFGLYTALGTFISLLLSIFFIPAFISAFSWKNKAVADRGDSGERSLFSKYLHIPLHRVLLKHPGKILTLWIIATVVSIGGIILIKRNVDIRNYFRKDNPARIAEEIMGSKFGGSKPAFVLFKGDVQSPEFLNTMLKAEEYMKKSPGIVATQSIARLIAEINGALGEEKRIPDEKDKIEQIWFLLEGNENVQKLVSDDLDEAIIISKFLSPENKEKKEFEEYMKKFISENSSSEFSIEVTGMPFIDVTMDRSLINSQIGSLIIAVLFAIFIVSVILRSSFAGLFAAIPIISTIIILFGVMGFSGIPLNMATVLVASIAMGIGVDYSIHVISHFNSHINEGATISKALDETIAISGKAIIINVISVSVGFLVLLFSEMVPLQYFGLLISLSMVGSGMSALTFLPVILILVNRKKKIALN